MLQQHPDIQELIEKSIAQAAEINPDRETNPVQSLDELYGFLDYTVTCMPWNIMPVEQYSSFATKCDQSILYKRFVEGRKAAASRKISASAQELNWDFIAD